MQNLTPREVVSELDKYIIGQADAKRSVAVGLRNRLRRLRLQGSMREEVKPKNLLMIGPTGVGKTEIARRLATLARAPFIKVEATKYTEVGYVGRDVESMVRDLVEQAVLLVKEIKYEEVRDKAEELAIKRIAKAMRPGEKVKKSSNANNSANLFDFSQLMEQMNQMGQEEEEEEVVTDEVAASRRQIRQQIRDGRLDDHEITIKVAEKKQMTMNLNPAMEQMMDLQDQMNRMRPKNMIKRTLTVKEALEILIDEESEALVNMDDINQEALTLAEEQGIIFIDEIDKIATKNQQGGGEVSREGVQRDILPIVEGSQVQTKYGMIHTDHILFVGSGAFHVAKPSDLIPELQGRFPIRVNLDDLTQEDFVKILSETENALTKQYQALLATEGVEITFTQAAIEKMAQYAEELNRSTDNIGARRLHTIIETVLDELLFEAADTTMGEIEITDKYVEDRLRDIVEDQDLSHYIL